MKVTLELPDNFDLTKINDLIGHKTESLSIQVEYDEPKDCEIFKHITNGRKVEDFVEDVWSKVFRPYFKHGYNDVDLNQLITKIEQQNPDEFSKVMEKLAEIFQETKGSYYDF